MIAGREGCHGYTIDLSNITCRCHVFYVTHWGLDNVHLNWFISSTGGRKQSQCFRKIKVFGMVSTISESILMYDHHHGHDRRHCYDRCHGYDRRHGYDCRHGYDHRHGYNRRHGYDHRHGYDRRHSYNRRHGYDRPHMFTIVAGVTMLATDAGGVGDWERLK